MEDERFIAGQLQERQHCQDIARILAEHLRKQGRRDADTWAYALEWFAKRITGGHRGINAQQEFDASFGVVDWRAFADSSQGEEI
ncbi:hypothetical protein ACFXJ8_26140 [Nonomuraea sp. NPDC059194]|uniref:hypothetical protein n=1 Tax=Nonomuraea sp. NPDC059194 TaxID=3346764 RepID=UPI00368814BF